MDNKLDYKKFIWMGWQGVGGFAWFMWGVSSFLSYWGFTHLNTAIPVWMKVVAIGFSIGMNFVEFMLSNMSIDELLDIKNVGDIVLRLFGVVCYLYDIWTNILGFMLVIIGIEMSLVDAWKSDSVMATFCILFGIAFAIGPEPLYKKYLNSKVEYPKLKVPSNNNQNSQPSLRPAPVQKPHFSHQAQTTGYDPKSVPAINPNWQKQHKKGKGDPRKVKSNIFLDQYTNRFKR